MLTLLLGGVRSGKTALAVRMGRQHDGAVTYLATGPSITGDADWDHRVATHRQERPADWHTVEEEVDLAPTLRDQGAGLIILDCLTLWVNNLLWRSRDHDDVVATARETATIAAERTAPTVVVSNEVGMGVHPETAAGREYRDVLGRVNQAWAAVADRTLLLVAGRALDLHDPDSLLDA